MAPIAANISKGLPLSNFGDAFNPSKLVSYPIEIKKISDNEIKCAVQYIDDFGNIITNLKANSVSLEDGESLKLKLEQIEISGKFMQFFEKGIKNAILFLVGSSGFLEISKNQGSAAVDLGVNIGDTITVIFPEVKK
jgi:S-adenosylmethionine hydrolase